MRRFGGSGVGRRGGGRHKISQVHGHVVGAGRDRGRGRWRCRRRRGRRLRAVGGRGRPVELGGLVQRGLDDGRHARVGVPERGAAP